MATQNRREKADIPLADLIDLFILSKRIEGRSEKTLTWYQSHLSRYVEFVRDDNPGTLRDLTLNGHEPSSPTCRAELAVTKTIASGQPSRVACHLTRSVPMSEVSRCSVAGSTRKDM